MASQRGRHRRPLNLASGKAYRGINTLALWATAHARAYSSGTWATYRQWQDAGAQVRKGEKAAAIVFWKDLTQEREADDERSRAFVARGYSVFNADQVDGYTPPAVPILPESERIAAAEQFVASIPAMIDHTGRSACYIPASDSIELPSFAQFRSARGYYATLSHELTHWSGAKPRLDRDLTGRFGDEAYAMEELVAELGAAFTLGRLGIAGEPRRDHTPYIANWLRVLKGDSRAIFTAAAKAQQAADYLAGFEAG